MENEESTQQQEDAIIHAKLSQATLQGYYHPQQSPREYLHNFLLQAKHAGCNVDGYILDEINQMLVELKR